MARIFPVYYTFKLNPWSTQQTQTVLKHDGPSHLVAARGQADLQDVVRGRQGVEGRHHRLRGPAEGGRTRPRLKLRP